MTAQSGKALRAVLILLALVTLGLFLLKPQAYSHLAYGPKVINGLSAKLLCSGVFVAGREAEAVYQRDVLTSHTLAQYGSYDVNPQLEQVSVSSFGLYRQNAQYNPGYGCSLYHDEPPKLSPPAITASAGFNWPADNMQPELQALLTEITAENSTKPHIDTRALLVAHKGQIIGEHYAEGYNRDSLFLSWSMAKSVTGTLVGIWLEQQGQNMDQSPNFAEWQNDERSEIQLRHLLNMASGLKFEETYEPGDNATRMLFFENDMAAYARTAKAEAAPGSKWVYSSGTTNILSGWLKSQTGSLDNYYRFAFEKLFAPAGMSSAIFEPDASGSFVGSSYLYMTARDWAKFGQLYLQRGELAGQRILPEHWVDFARTPIAPSKGKYGGQFWLNAEPQGGQRRFSELPADFYQASGHNGQFVSIIPSQELVIVRLGWANGERFDINRHFGAISNYIAEL
ncbi:MAG: beta-lactamase family protein [Cellvibrionaceae bacterium]|nr:beta-lactamase family protein [Cellvibrionaceae bacterium]